MKNLKYDLEERLIGFSSGVLKLVTEMPITLVSRHLGKQLIRSASSPALHYGEVQASESKADFIHKMKIILKELRETQICLKLIMEQELLEMELLTPSVQECSELVAIFTKSIQTAQQNSKGKK